MKDRALRRFDGRRATTLYAILMLALFPLFTGISGYVYLQLKKYLFFLAATLLWVTVLCVDGCVRFTRTHSLPRLNLADGCVIAFAALACLSTCLSDYGVFFTTEIGKYDSLLVYLLYACILLGVSRHGLNLRRCLVLFAAAYSLCCAIAVVQLCGWNALWLFPDGMNYYSPFVRETGAFLGTMGNVDVFSGLHCLALPLITAAFFALRDRRRFLLLIPAALGIVTLALSGVASGILAVSVTAIVLIPFYAFGGREGERRGLLRFSGLALLLLGLAAAYLIPFRQGTAFELHELLHGRAEDSFGSHRILIWRGTVEVLRDHPLLGIGPDSLADHLNITFERYSQPLGETIRTYVDNAHNAYLQALVSFGVLGCVPLSILAAETVSGLRPGFRSDRAIRVLCPPLLCFAIQALFNVGTCMLTPIFLILWAALLHEERTTE